MTQQSDSVLNGVLIDMARSFLQYVAEGWPWVSSDAQSIEQQVLVIAARQRQDVAQIAELLTEREHFIDFGSFPTEYTDLQFLALESMFQWLHNSHQTVLNSLAAGIDRLKTAGDDEGAKLLQIVELHQKEDAAALKDLQGELANAG